MKGGKIMIYKTTIQNGPILKSEEEIVTQAKIPSMKDFEREFLKRFGAHVKHFDVYYLNEDAKLVPLKR